MANNSQEIDDVVTSTVTTLIANGNDPRVVLSVMLANCAGIGNMILQHNKATARQIAAQFAMAIADATAPPEEEAKSVIEVVSANDAAFKRN